MVGHRPRVRRGGERGPRRVDRRVDGADVRRARRVHHTDMSAGGAMFRVFLLRDTLQVDLGLLAGVGVRRHRTDVSSRIRHGDGSTRSPRILRPAAHRDGLALRAPCPVEHRARQGVAGGIHDQRPARPRARAGMRASRGAGGAGTRDGSAACRGQLADERGARAHARPGRARRAFRSCCVLLLAEIQEADAELAAQLSATIQELASVDAGANPGEVP